jgi:hypothetical protein
VALLAISCQRQNKILLIMPTPIYSETDSFISSTNYLQHNRDDYFIVKTNIKNKNEIIKAVDDFVNRNAFKRYSKYDNYSMSFYRESPEVNESALSKYVTGNEYKMFLYNKDDYILTFSYYRSKLIIRIVN